MYSARLLFASCKKLNGSLALNTRKAHNVTNDIKLSVQEVELQKLSGEDYGISVIKLNRPKFKNALSTSFVNKLEEILQNVKLDNMVRVLILRSLVPNVFCAGADLKERATFTQRDVSNFVDKLQVLFSGIERLPVPVIAALDGLALGGGMEISLACDIRVASDTAKLGLVETKLAIIPGAGGTQRLPRIINPSVAKELIFTARVLDGQEAYNLGIVNHVVVQNQSGDAAYQESLKIARNILPNGPIAIKMAKQAINNGLQTDITTGMAIEKACYAQLLPTKDRTEGFTAFNEKRIPKYVGE